MAPVNGVDPAAEQSSSYCYAKQSWKNADLMSTLAENVRCMQRRPRREGGHSVGVSPHVPRLRPGGRKDGQISTETWTSGRLRTDDLEDDVGTWRKKTCTTESHTRSRTFPSHLGFVGRVDVLLDNWRVLLCAVVLCIFLTKIPMCTANCYGLGTTGRAIFTALEGSISDHPNQSYPEHQKCEWLIRAPSSDMKIMLTFTSFGTECSYDFVSIYDGDSHRSKMIASYSGDFIPSTIMAESGQMLIYLYSDRNYNLRGFDATYTIHNCSMACSGHGSCVDHTCVCDTGYTGEGCDCRSCPYECGNEWNQGTCQISQCVCEEGYVGEGCSLSTANDSGWGQSFLVSSGDAGGLSRRTGHAAVYHQETDSLWIFGGFDLNTPLEDLLQYSFETDEWAQVTPNGGDRPSGRYGHTMELYDNQLVVFGGRLANGSRSNELWSFDLSTLTWELLPPGTESIPPGISQHSSCIVEYSYLVILGGESEDDFFLGTIYKYDLQVPSGWEEIIPVGGVVSQFKLRDHSSVYHYDTKSIVVFGGIHANADQRHNSLYAFQFEERYWTVLSQSKTIRERSFHSANIIGNYMVVYGGNVHDHILSYQDLDHTADYGINEKCFEEGVELYHLGCHKWISFDELAQDFIDPVDRNSYSITRGRFHHAAVVRDETTLIIVGGYNGVTLGDVLAIKMPGSVATNPATRNESRNLCAMHKSDRTCEVDPSCGWCTEPASCLSFSASQSCSGDFAAAACPGICSALTTCEACMVWGQGPQTSTFDPNVTRVNGQCGWCVQDRQCYPLTAPSGRCQSPGSSETTSGWWGSSGTFISDFAQCKTHDFPPGMTWIKYRHPQNLSQPDELAIISETVQTLKYIHQFALETIQGGTYTAVYKGYVYPMEATPPQSETLKVWLHASQADADLFMSTDADSANKELIASFSGSGESTVLAERDVSGEAIFPDTSAGNRYYTELVLEKPIHTITYRTQSMMELLWNGNMQHSTFTYQGFSAEYIRPYASDSCTDYSTCYGCLTDASCGWCPLSGTCEERNGATLAMDHCGTASRPIEHYLVIDVESCGNCSQYWNCDHCTSDPLCEWVAVNASCTRRGRFDIAVRDVGQCNPRCHEITDCKSCIDIKKCAWCADTGTCFHFNTYISSFVHGECSHWFDMEDNQCPSCSAHQTCGDCLNTFQCGWCGNVNDPIIGVCHNGDFGGTFSDSNCTELVAAAHNTSLADPADWSYAICPDVDECRLLRHDCHGNATCINTHEAYECECNYGYEGDGKEECNRTCYHTCEYGHCSGAPDYECICDLGWTGLSCNISCGCNNHSTCVNGVGLCDECQDWSTGTYCELCLSGSYGNATTPAGCQECDCHGHGNASLGNCHGQTGVCYCTGNTVGDHCENCVEGFFGEPHNGGKCYQECHGRTVITSAHSSSLGSYEGGGMVDPGRGYCLWILTPFGSLEEAAGATRSPGAVVLTVDSIEVECGRDTVYVYDGVPQYLHEDFAAMGESSEIGVYCGHDDNSSLQATAYSGVMTIVFQANVSAASPTQGFTAIYDVRTCGEDCDGNWYCAEEEDETDEEEVCECSPGFAGDNCQTEECPNNCGLADGNGMCNDDLNLCQCNSGYGGDGCEHPHTMAERESDARAVWSTLYDASRLASNDLTAARVGPVSRMGHVMVADGAGVLWVFGGYAQDDHRLDDVWSYQPATSTWTHHPHNGGAVPAARSHHAAAMVSTNTLIMSGGLSDTGIYGDWWEYNLTTGVWTQLVAPITDLEIAGHTMTQVDKTTLIVVGGYSPDDGLVARIIDFDTSTLIGRYKNSGGTPPTGLYGHSAVWHQATESLYVFGGYRFHLDELAVSNKLYAFHYPMASWSILPAEGFQPAARMYHSAVTFSDYLLVLGGHGAGSAIEHSVVAYHYACNRWQVLDGEGLSVGAEAELLHSQAAVLSNGVVYQFGGFNGATHGTMRAGVVPTDLCTLQSTVNDCVSTPGCSACVEGAATLVACLSNHDLSSSSCPSPRVLQNGSVCNIAYIEARDCRARTICGECVTVFPAHIDADQPCKWCYNCPDGACIPVGADCLEENNCQVEVQNEYTDRSQCSEITCEASDCPKCIADNNCVWTRQFKRSSETRRLLNHKPIYDWNCFSKRLLAMSPPEYELVTVPPQSCPTPCSQHTTCGDCLSSLGADGGWQECVWSTWLSQCMSPTYLHLRCAVGECGPVVQGASENCPTPCYANSQCAHCLRQAWCGWCPIPGGNGTGICLSGGLHGPTDGECSAKEISWVYTPEFNVSTNGVTPDWTYLTCPPENECLNGHHNCGDNEVCIDQPTSYECQCKDGYERNSVDGPCEPICAQDCGEHGVCVAPGQCQCNFGYVGQDCGVECECNGHSDCAGVDATKQCLSCQNNTTGDQCQRCLPLFVGNPEEGGTCRPCYTLCNNNSHMCLSPKDYNRIDPSTIVSPANISDLSPYGPVNDDVICINCSNFSEGDHCDQCIDGYFKLDGHFNHCRECDCNGHGSLCEKDSGECNECQNNTMSPTCPSEEYSEPCWEHQCSQCINDLFKGTPTDSHQCYRQMHVDNDICFHPDTRTDCPINAEPLPNGASSFFVIMPKYSDLDIRLTVDVTYGALDVYVTYDSDVFVVEYDEELQQQIISIDENYINSASQVRRRSVHDDSIPDWAKEAVLKRMRRSDNVSVVTTPNPGQGELSEVSAQGLNTFLSIEDEHFITVVRQLENRLVITFPRQYHQLTSRRFYIALVGHGAVDYDATQGIMYFRQDQPHIDLFIFFSVFLSCFFLFLAFLIGIWKVKVGVEARQHRRMHLQEMEHRASRPFGQVLLYYENPSIQTHQAPAPTSTGKGHSLQKKHHRLGRIRGKVDSSGAANTEGEEMTLNAQEIVNERFLPGLIASEPTDDGMATIGTVVIALPGQMRAPVRACLGSALITLKTVSKPGQDMQTNARQQRQTKAFKSSLLCNINNRR
ncbi:multiple epidermal growth factor-like domains protein 8 [Diadema setosum]|uniref:multiple epidermal growth factor-like domains protein 8 n=1 Tax=Diadema setosum TaxID=31175 RepID=UPI003B3A7A24